MTAPAVRPMREEDWPAVRHIYQEGIDTGHATFEAEAPRDGQKHKSSSLARLLDDLPHLTWVLVGDDGEHDPTLYGDLAGSHPDRVAAIGLRQVRPAETDQGKDSIHGVPVLRGADGDELLPLLRDALDCRPPAGT